MESLVKIHGGKISIIDTYFKRILSCGPIISGLIHDT